MRDKVILSKMQFFGRHGCSEAEVELGQRFEVDVEIEVSLREPGLTDNVEDTIPYDKVFYDVKEIVQGPHKKLVETVAADIVAAIFEKYPEANGVMVRIMKPGAPVAGTFAALGCEIHRQRR